MQNIFFAKKEFSFEHMNDKSMFYLQYLTICSVALCISALSRGAMRKSATLYVSYHQRVGFIRFFLSVLLRKTIVRRKCDFKRKVGTDMNDLKGKLQLLVQVAVINRSYEYS